MEPQALWTSFHLTNAHEKISQPNRKIISTFHSFISHQTIGRHTIMNVRRSLLPIYHNKPSRLFSLYIHNCSNGFDSMRSTLSRSWECKGWGTCSASKALLAHGKRGQSPISLIPENTTGRTKRLIIGVFVSCNKICTLLFPPQPHPIHPYVGTKEAPTRKKMVREQ